MNTPTYMAEDAVIQRGVEALMSALGPIETARFLNLPGRRILDYVEWHSEWQNTLDIGTFLDEVFAPQLVETDTTDSTA